MFRPSTSSYNKKIVKSESQARNDLIRVLAQRYLNELLDSGNDDDDSDEPETCSSKTPSQPSPDMSTSPDTTPSPPGSDNTKTESSPSARQSASANTSPSSSQDSNMAKEKDAPPPTKEQRSSQHLKNAILTPETFKVQRHTGRLPPIGKSLPKAKRILDDDDDESPTARKAKSKATKISKGKQPITDSNQEAAQPTPGNDSTTNAANKPTDAKLAIQWNCANRDCNTGQTWYARDGGDGGRESYGRKVISNFFGRNKAETHRIHPDVWHNYCRKCYQRENYRATSKTASPQAKCKVSLDNIEMQLVRIELWRPQATFNVQLWKAAATRLNLFFKARSQPGATAAEARKAATKAGEKNRKGEEKPLKEEWAFPIELLERFEANFCKEAQSIEDIRRILEWVTELSDRGEIKCMPPMEFLISEVASGETVKDAAQNFWQWCDHEDGILGAENDEDMQDAAQEADVLTEQATQQNLPPFTIIDSIEPPTTPNAIDEPQTPVLRRPFPGSRFLEAYPGALDEKRTTTWGMAHGSGRADARSKSEHYFGRKMSTPTRKIPPYSVLELEMISPRAVVGAKRTRDVFGVQDGAEEEETPSKRFKSI